MRFRDLFLMVLLGALRRSRGPQEGKEEIPRVWGSMHQPLLNQSSPTLTLYILDSTEELSEEKKKKRAYCLNKLSRSTSSLYREDRGLQQLTNFTRTSFPKQGLFLSPGIAHCPSQKETQRSQVGSRPVTLNAGSIT